MATNIKLQNLTQLPSITDDVDIDLQIHELEVAISASELDLEEHVKTQMSKDVIETTTSIITSDITMDEMQIQTGKSRNLGKWDYYASDRIHLRDVLVSGYILSWILGITAGILTVFFTEYVIFTLFHIHFCHIENNTNKDLFHIHFLSNISFAYAFQQWMSLLLGFSGYWLYHSPEIIGIAQEQLIKWRIYAFTIASICLFGVMIFIVPFHFDTIRMMMGVSLLLWIVFGCIVNGIEGGRRIAIIVITWIILYMGNGGLSLFVFSRLTPNWFGIIYPFYLTIFETFIFYFISIFDIPKCCRAKNWRINNDNNGSGLGAIYFWTDRDLYVFVSAINVFVESWRCASLIMLKNDYFALISTFILSIISEIFTRNNLYYEIFYRLIWRQSAPPLTRVYSIYLGCKLHTEYVPIFIVILYNLLNFGYTNDCQYKRRMMNMDISDNYWFILIFIGLEFMCDVCGHWSNKLFVKVLKIFDKEDEARRVKYVKLKMRDIILASIHLSFACIQAFLQDSSSRQLK